MSTTPNRTVYAYVYEVEVQGNSWMVVAEHPKDALGCIPDYDRDHDLPVTIKAVPDEMVVSIVFDPAYGVEAATPHGVPDGAEVEAEEGLVHATAEAWAELLAPHVPEALCSERWLP